RLWRTTSPCPSARCFPHRLGPRRPVATFLKSARLETHYRVATEANQRRLEAKVPRRASPRSRRTPRQRQPDAAAHQRRAGEPTEQLGRHEVMNQARPRPAAIAQAASDSDASAMVTEHMTRSCRSIGSAASTNCGRNAVKKAMLFGFKSATQ